mgnify:CR=1 FL=1
MIETVAGVLAALKALNDGLNVLKETAGHGQSLQGLVSRWGEASEKYNDVERAKAGKMSYRESLAMESAKRQLENFDRQFKDICLMQNQGDLYNAVKQRMAESERQHRLEVARIKKRRKQIREWITLSATIAFAWVFFMGCVWAVVWVLENSPVE